MTERPPKTRAQLSREHGAAPRPADLAAGVRGVHRLRVLSDLLGDEAGVQLLGHAVTSLLSALIAEAAP